MNTKILSLIAGLFLVFSLVTVSALSFSPNPITLTKANLSTQVSLTNGATYNQTITLSSSSSSVSVNASSFNLGISESRQLNISTLASTISSLDLGSTAYTITASNTTNNETGSLTVNLVNSFCSNGEKGNLSIRNVDITNNGDGDDNTWQRLDTLTIDVDVKNVGADTDDDVIVEIGVFDSDGYDITGDFDFSNKDEETYNIGSLDKGDTETATFEIKVPADVASGSGYQLAVKAYVDSNEDVTCADSSSDLSDTYFEEIEVKKETDSGKYMGFDNIDFDASEYTCGETVSLRAEVFNLGSKTQDQTLVTLTSSALGVSKSEVIRKDLEEGDKAAISFDFVIPSSATDKTYSLELSAQYGYDEHDDAYDDSLDDAITVPLKIIGCSVASTTSSSSLVTATLASEAKAGQPLTVNINIKNTGSSSANFVVDATGYDSWASKATLSERIVNLAAGESKDLAVTLDVNSGVSGSQSFNVETLVGQTKSSKAVSVNVAAVQGVSLGGNTMLWVIGAINLVLVIVIIIVAVRVSRR